MALCDTPQVSHKQAADRPSLARVQEELPPPPGASLLLAHRQSNYLLNTAQPASRPPPLNATVRTRTRQGAKPQHHVKAQHSAAHI
jgi:hypothetical protein